MTKYQKKTILAGVLFTFAIIQIFNFALRPMPSRFPVFYLNLHERGMIDIVLSDINWLFKLINHILYRLFGWTAILSPLLLFAFGSTLFAKRETEKVKRKRLILLWGIAELLLFVYFANIVSFIILPQKVSPGIVASIFARYLQNVGGVTFFVMFFTWSLISYILFIKKSNWKELSIIIKKSLKGSLKKGISSIPKQPNKLPPKRRKKVKKIKYEDSEIEIEEKEPAIDINANPEAATIINVKEKFKEEQTPSTFNPNDIIEQEDVEFSEIIIEEFDTTIDGTEFNYSTLNQTKPAQKNLEYIDTMSKKINSTLTSVGVDAKYAGYIVTSRLIRYEYEFPTNMKLIEVEKYKDEISSRLGGIEVEMDVPILNTDKFGIYIERKSADTLGLGSYLTELKNKKARIPLFLGVGSDGSVIWEDASSFPHLLIGGTTGSGKSVFLNNILINLIAISEIQPLNLVLIDPKRVEFVPYKSIRQLAHPVITETEDAREVLKEAVNLMEERYKSITEHGVRNIFEYNETSTTKMPFLFIIIDEFSDLVMQDKTKNIKENIIRLAQKSRAVGIHVIIATQRPSSDVIDGLIKANFPSRISFKTSSKVDSRIILDQNGAEKLLGKGDMIIKTTNIQGKRAQGVYIDINEIKSTVEQA